MGEWETYIMIINKKYFVKVSLTYMQNIVGLGWVGAVVRKLTRRRPLKYGNIFLSFENCRKQINFVIYIYFFCIYVSEILTKYFLLLIIMHVSHSPIAT